MESESPLEVLSRAATMLHREDAAAESSYVTTSEYCTNNRPGYKSFMCRAYVWLVTKPIGINVRVRVCVIVLVCVRVDGKRANTKRPKYRARRFYYYFCYFLSRPSTVTTTAATASARAGFPDRYRSGRFLRPAVGSVAYAQRPVESLSSAGFSSGRKTLPPPFTKLHGTLLHSPRFVSTRFNGSPVSRRRLFARLSERTVKDPNLTFPE